MRLAYISPSALPSRAANAVHVMFQCDGFVRAGAEVTLYAKRGVRDERQLPAVLRDAYGVDVALMRLVTFFSERSRADTMRIASLALSDLRRHEPDVILSRNLYAAFVLAVLRRRPILFETHQLEIGTRRLLQRMIMTRPWVTTVAISQRLVECLEEHHGVRPSRPIVLPDAAPDGIESLPAARRRAVLRSLVPRAEGAWDAVCGYFGQLYQGRGVEIVEAMAAARPRCLFLVYGGNESDIAARRTSLRLPNLEYMGHVPHPVASRVMAAVDVLLMPYQESVSIGVKGHDTARWMSPMKMFEYLATGVPILSSDLPVLREVLRDRENCLLVPPARAADWVAALDLLMAEPALARAVGERAHQDYLAGHTWSRRAERLLAAACQS
jgi:glycosyltransferase involved in cell wall biosynthesis